MYDRKTIDTEAGKGHLIHEFDALLKHDIKNGEVYSR